jgi:lysylphosphatidylglycerol synthetase-like protein (DUF2156 family)
MAKKAKISYLKEVGIGWLWTIGTFVVLNVTVYLFFLVATFDHNKVITGFNDFYFQTNAIQPIRGMLFLILLVITIFKILYTRDINKTRRSNF